MIKTLVSVEVDLASSLAIRFICQLGGSIDLEINPVYVKESLSGDSFRGAGWASRTWQREMIEKGKEEISKMIGPEMDFCPKLSDPRVIYGDRHSEVSKVAQEGNFDLYVEGVDFTWNHAELYKLAHTKFYQRLACPIILVQSLRKLKHVLLLCLDVAGTEVLTEIFKKIWNGSSVPLVLAYPSPDAAKPEGIDLTEKVLQSIAILKSAGCAVEQKCLNSESLSNPGEDDLKDYGLVAIGLDRAVRKDSVELEWLSLAQTASLIAFY